MILIEDIPLLPCDLLQIELKAACQFVLVCRLVQGMKYSSGIPSTDELRISSTTSVDPHLCVAQRMMSIDGEAKS